MILKQKEEQIFSRVILRDLYPKNEEKKKK